MRNIAILFLTAISILLIPYCYAFAQQGFLLYENPDYNIKIQYPANWTKSEVNLAAHVPVYFPTPPQYSFETPNASMSVFVKQQDNKTFDQTLTEIGSDDQQRIQNGEIKVVNSSYVSLSGLRAWQQIYYDYANDKNIKTLVVLTVKDGEQYQLVFRAQPGEFNKYLPIAEKMIKSFQITK